MLGGSNIRNREFSTSGKFARAAQIFNYSSTEFAEGFFKTISSSASAVSHTEAGSAEKLGMKKVDQ